MKPELAFFKRHLKSVEEVVVLQNPDQEHLAFVEVALEVIGRVAEKWGFERTMTKIEKDQTTLVFAKATQKIELRASTDYRDAPFYFNLILWALLEDGEGESWYSVALWHMQRVMEGTDVGTEYAFPYKAEVEMSLRNAALDLENFGASFLEGDLEVFEVARRRN